MAVTARTWVPGELNTAAKMNTLRDDILELDAVAGFNDTQFGTITITGTNLFANVTVSAMSARAWPVGNFRADANIGGGYLTKINSTTLRATRGSGDDLGGGQVVCSYAIVDPRG